MPHASLKLIPGVDRNRTPALNEAAISDSNLIRFVPDRQGIALPQKLGGWTKYFDQSLNTPVRSLWAWADTNANNYLGIAAEDGVYTLQNGDLVNRSPQVYLASPTMNFSTTSGSDQVIIADNGSNITNFDSIFLNTPVSVGGVVLFGFYSCTAVTANSYSITSRNAIGLSNPATSTVSSGGATPSFVTTSGSATVSVTLANHGYSVGSTLPVIIPVNVGGLTLSGNYIVTSVTSSSVFTIASEGNASSAATVSQNNGRPSITYYIGRSILPLKTGYGDGGYGSGGYGIGVTSGGSRTFTTTAASTSTNPVTGVVTATLSFASAYNVPIGSEITVTGVTPSGYNSPTGQPWIVTARTSASVSFVVPAALGAQTAAGVITVNQFAYYEVEDWTLDNWGEYLLAGHRAGDIYYWDVQSGGSNLTVVPNAPTVNEGYFVAMPERQVIAYGSTFNGIQDPLLVRWCDIGDLTTWIGTVTNQAGSYRIPKGSKIVGGLQGPQQGLLWTDVGLWSMQYINLPYVWSFNEIGTGCGLIGQKAAATMSGTVYWMSQNQFFSLSGGGIQIINCPVWDVIFQEIDMDYAGNIRCATNSRFGEVAWYYPTKGSGGEPNKYVKYNTIIGQWDFGVLTRTAWIDQSVLGAPIGAGSGNFVYQHEEHNGQILTDADGQAMNSFIETGYFALQDGDAKTFVDQFWPDMKWGLSGGVQSADVKITFKVTDYPSISPKSHGPYSVDYATTYVTPRLRGRLIAIRVESDDTGSFWRLGNFRYRLQPDGKF